MSTHNPIIQRYTTTNILECILPHFFLFLYPYLELSTIKPLLYNIRNTNFYLVFPDNNPVLI